MPVSLAAEITCSAGVGAGRGGTTPALAAVINAVVDALGEFGVTHMDMPATPERIWRTIQEGQAAKTAKAADRAIVKT